MKFQERIESLRKDLFAAIDYAIRMDGHHKSYEGQLSFTYPHRFDDVYTVGLSCYVIGPGRFHAWEGDSFEEAFDNAEKDIRQWIKEEYEHDY